MKKWLKENVFVKDMFIYVLIAAIIFYIPVWASFIYGFVTGKDVLFAFGAAYVLLWAGPFTPTIPAILGIAIFLKQLVKRIKGSHEEDDL